MRIHTCFLSFVLVAGCDSGDPEIDPACQQGAELIELCAGVVPDGYFEACAADTTRAEELTAAECPATMGKSDGWFGWKAWGERCWFNWECAGGLECRPFGYEVPSDQACLEPGVELGQAAFGGDWCGDWCDDDDDCADGLLCRDEGLANNGMCVSSSHAVEHYAICASDFH